MSKSTEQTSMDPTKWRVAQISYTISGTGAWVPVGEYTFWGVFPPHASEPLEVLYVEHREAMVDAQRRAMFAVVPPKVLRELTNQEDA